MSAPVGGNAFLPWLRRGISTRADAEASAGGRLSVPVTVSFGEGRQASVTLRLFGPGEVRGLDPRLVVRTWPAPNVHDAEPNFFPLIEFHAPDLPWRYSPVAAPVADRLLPWLCLIVVSDEEVGDLLPAGGTRPLPVVVISDAPLPRLDQAWAWAHAQLAGAESLTPDQARELLAAEPHLLVSRLLCPRRLDPGTRYTALLVPTFESGRRAGMGLPADDAADPLAPAWAPGTRSVQLPFFYRWRFTTGLVGDFEELVKRLQPARLPPTVGIRAMDVRNLGTGLPPAAEGPLGLEGALRAPTTPSTPWPDAEREPFVDALRGLLNRPAELLEDGDGERSVAPPLYGQWHAARDRLEPGGQPFWFHDANGDPRSRVAAGLGTQVVQANQRQLMAGAWRQAEGLADVNDRLRGAQFAREMALRVHARHLVGHGNDELVLQLTAPVHARVLASPITVAARLQESPVAEGAVGSTWRRIARPLGPIGRRQSRPPGERSQVVARMNRAELSPAPPPPTPAGAVTPSRAGKELVPNWASAQSVASLRVLSRLPVLAGGIGLAAAGIVLLLRRPRGVAAALAAAGAAALAGAAPLRRLVERAERGLAVRDGTLTPRSIRAAPARPDFVAVESELVGGAPPLPPTGERGRGDSPSARAFRAATTAMLASVASTTGAETPLRSVALRELREKLVAALDPRATVGARVGERLQLADGVLWQPDDPLEPVLAGPDFPQPMYRHLAELSLDWVLPGLEQVGANTVSLVVTNQPFVEAFMLGLNHEMGRELLWREFPTDQRRTYFRQFWDPSGFAPRPGQTPDPEELKDIRPIHRWEASARVGENGARGQATGERLVLLVRGDVLLRYPNLVVYAARAVLNPETGKREPGAEEQQPVFGGTLGADVAFFGFPLTPEEVRGGPGDLGWFFVLQEQPGEPRFGLDLGEPGAPPPPTWNDLHWGHLVAAGEELDAVDYVDLDAELPDTSLIDEPPGVAWHVRSGTNAAQLAFAMLQRPVRVAIHANDMLQSSIPA